jgi:hypothetical protein
MVMGPTLKKTANNRQKVQFILKLYLIRDYLRKQRDQCEQKFLT